MKAPDLSNSPVAQIFPEQVNEVSAGNCPLCKKHVIYEDFKDDLSITEYNISGMCQTCQDDIFTE